MTMEILLLSPFVMFVCLSGLEYKLSKIIVSLIVT